MQRKENYMQKKKKDEKKCKRMQRKRKKRKKKEDYRDQRRAKAFTSAFHKKKGLKSNNMPFDDFLALPGLVKEGGLRPKLYPKLVSYVCIV